MAWVTGSLPQGSGMRKAGFAILRTARLRISRLTDGQLSTAAGQGKGIKVSSLPIRQVLGPLLTAPLLAACAGAYPPPGPGVIDFANPYQFPYEAPGFNPDYMRAADYTRPAPSGVAPPRFAGAGDAGDFDLDHDLMVAGAGYVVGRTGERLLGQAFKPATSGMAGISSGATPLGTGRMMGWEMLAADGAPAAAIGRTAMSGTGVAAEKAAENIGTAVTAESTATRSALSAGSREAAAVTARTAVGAAGRAGATAVAGEAANAGRTALTVGRAAGVARTAMGAGTVLEAGAAAGAAEMLVGAAVIAGSAYVAYKIYESYREGNKTPSTP
jgi:hypothetical protein